jgi:hypothetical protein
MKVTLEQLEKTYEKYKGKYAGLKNDYFAPLYVAAEHKRPIEDILNNCAYGGHDYGIDAYYINAEARNLYIYQFKWSERYEAFKDSYKRLIEAGVDRIFGNPYTDSRANELIQKLKRQIDECKDVIKRVYIRFVFNGDAKKADEDIRLTCFKEELENKKTILDKYFECEIELKIEYISNSDSVIEQVSNTKESHKYKISFKSQSKKKADSGDLYLGFINLYDLYTMHCKMGKRFFERNIRFGLDESEPPNRAIKNSLKRIFSGEMKPEDFTFHHNGITIFAEEFEPDDNDSADIIEPRILNGAQTITTLYFFIEKELQKLPDKKERLITMLKNIEVIGKVITKCKKDFVTEVTISNNKQNPVDAWNLRANDNIQLDFEEIFRTELNIFYERQENSFKSYQESELEEHGFDKYQPKQISVTKLAQTFLAFQGNIDRISNINYIFENEELYKKTFSESYLKINIRKIIIAYKIHFRKSAIAESIKVRSLDMYHFTDKAKDLIWALTIQGLFNVYEINDLLDDYGNDLTISVDFKDIIINEIGSKKIWLIFSDLFKEYQKDIKGKKFAFLKKRETFTKCMTIAKNKFGWKTITL